MRVRTAHEIWEAALGELQIQVNKTNYRTWLQKTIGLDYRDGLFVVGVPNAFIAEYLDRNQRSLIERTLISLMKHDTRVTFQVANGELNMGNGYAAPASYEDTVPIVKATTPAFNPKYTFDSFITGNSNRLAYAAAMGVAENPGHTYNPLFIYGGVGLGKTHLLHAIGHVAQANHIQVLFVSAEQFTNEFVNAIRHKKTEDFHHKYRGVDMLLIDDIHFISGKEQTEESFFHTFNELHNANRQIAITSDRPPKSIPFLESRLRSRFEWGLIADIQPPDLETRLAILQAKAEQNGAEISPDVLEVIAQRVKQNVRELEGLLNRTIAYAKLFGTAPNVELATQAIEDIATRKPKQLTLTPNQIIDTVAGCFELTAADLKGRKRDRDISLARQVAMYLIREETESPLTRIGKEMGDRDHSTVIHACDKITGAMESNPDLKQKIQAIRELIQK